MLSPEEQKDAQRHAEVLAALRALVETVSGREFLKYCFREFGVGELPALGVSGDFLHGQLGHLRAGNSIFKLVAEAHPEYAGRLLAEVEKERLNDLREISKTSSDEQGS